MFPVHPPQDSCQCVRRLLGMAEGGGGISPGLWGGVRSSCKEGISKPPTPWVPLLLVCSVSAQLPLPPRSLL